MALAALLLSALLPLPAVSLTAAAFLTPLPLVAFPPLALGLPLLLVLVHLLPLLTSLLLELLVSWVPLSVEVVGAIPSTLVSNTCVFT